VQGRERIFSLAGPQMLLQNGNTRVTCPDLRHVYSFLEAINGWQTAVCGPAGWHTHMWGGRHFGEVSREFPPWDRSILTEIYLCQACSYQEILRMDTPGQVQILDRGDGSGVFVGVVGKRFDPTQGGPLGRKGGEEASEFHDKHRSSD
jgi:hypothetical protein